MKLAEVASLIHVYPTLSTRIGQLAGEAAWAWRIREVFGLGDQGQEFGFLKRNELSPISSHRSFADRANRKRDFGLEETARSSNRDKRKPVEFCIACYGCLAPAASTWRHHLRSSSSEAPIFSFRSEA